jgi:hypothetical protein
MSNKDRYDLQLKNVVRHLSQSIIEATDEEIREDARQAGVDLQAHAADMKRQFETIAKTMRQKKLVVAKEAYEIEVEKLRRPSFTLPSSPTEQRALLQLIAVQHATGSGLFTAQFRDFDKLSDNDVASLLEELAALGLLSDTGSRSG